MKRDKDDIGCGRKSGIPECCIKYWVTHFYPYSEVMKSIPDWVEYVPCPSCIKHKRFVKIYTCDSKDYDTCSFNCYESKKAKGNM